MSELEFRFNIGARIFTDVVWYAAQLSVFEVLFRQTKSMNGWNLPETRVFMGVLFMTDAIYMMLFSENLDRLSDKVRKGDLDLLLVKPVNAQWMVSFQKVSVAYFGNLLVATAWLIWSLIQIDDLVWWRVAWLLIAIPIGVTISYALRFMIAALALFLTRAEAVTYIWYQLYRLGTRPHSFYPIILRYSVITVLPIAFVASVPAEVLLGKASPIVLLLGIFVSGALVHASTLVWQSGLRRYGSASS